jgi:hypothetical protein
MRLVSCVLAETNAGFGQLGDWLTAPSVACTTAMVTAVVFGLSALAKAGNVGAVAQAIGELTGWSQLARKPVAAMLVLAELTLSVGALWAAARPEAGIAQLALGSSAFALGVFGVLGLRVLRRGLTVSCACFGGDSDVTSRTVLRAFLLTAVASAATVGAIAQTQSPSFDEWLMAAAVASGTISLVALYSAVFRQYGTFPRFGRLAAGENPYIFGGKEDR